MRDRATLIPDVGERHRKQRRMAALAAVTLVTFLVLAGINLDNARQVFDISLTETIEAVESGSALRQVALVGFAAVALALLATGQRRSPRPDPVIAVPLGLLLGVIAVSAVWAIDPQLTFRRAVAYGLMLVGVYVCASLLSMRQIIIGALLFTGGFVAIALAAQLLAGSFTPGLGSWRLAGIVHPVALSWYCSLGAIAAVAVARFERSYRIPATWAAVILLGCLLLTKTRTGLGATLAAILVFWLLTSERRVHQDIPVAVTWIALVAFLVALAFPGDHFSWVSIYSETAEVSSFGRTDAVEQIATFTGRLPVWEASLALAAQRPVLGFGFSAFQSAEMIPILAEAAGWVPTSTHSGYVDALLSLGLVGLALLVFVLGASLVRSIRTSRGEGRYAFTAAVLVWLLVTLAFESPVLFDPIFSSFLVLLLIVKLALFSDPADGSRDL